MALDSLRSSKSRPVTIRGRPRVTPVSFSLSGRCLSLSCRLSDARQSVDHPREAVRHSGRTQSDVGTRAARGDETRFTPPTQA
jgi:hypothetical protein